MATKSCERCGNEFNCEAESITNCWCTEVQMPPALRTKIASLYNDCLCAACLQQLAEVAVAPPVQGDDYYFNEQGRVVFTAAFLKRRGYCCGSGCLHCPYGT